MSTKRLLLLLMTVAISSIVNAQHPVVFCGFDHFMKLKKTHQPAYYQAYEDLFRQWKSNGNSRGGSETYSLPVVFHIVYNTPEQNIADSVVYSQLDVINEDYRRMNIDAINTRDIFLPFAADCEIEFYLAQTDPQGNPTTGITHTLTDRSSFDLDFFAQENTLDEVKHSESGGVDAWDPQHYINIWVCNIGDTGFGQLFGLSYPPSGLDNWPAGSSAPDIMDEGVIVHYTTVGRNNPQADADGTSLNNLGRTLTHEMGHFLGLRHTWGDELFTDICSQDDGIDDTPLCGSGDQFSCNYENNSCNSGEDGDLPDMLENYMDYTQDYCYNMFTNDQKSLMRYVIEELRNSLLNPVSTNEITSSLPISLYPNPATSRIGFSSPDKTASFIYTISNSVGQVVLNGSTSTRSIDISALPGGHYFLSIIGNENVSGGRFLVN